MQSQHLAVVFSGDGRAEDAQHPRLVLVGQRNEYSVVLGYQPLLMKDLDRQPLLLLPGSNGIGEIDNGSNGHPGQADVPGLRLEGKQVQDFISENVDQLTNGCISANLDGQDIDLNKLAQISFKSNWVQLQVEADQKSKQMKAHV